VRIFIGDAQRGLIPRSKFDFVLANEVIADFEMSGGEKKPA
jgi:hypothetical protein